MQAVQIVPVKLYASLSIKPCMPGSRPVFLPCACKDEEEEFIKLLDNRDLAASADPSLLAHLLLRADTINRRTTDWRRLKAS